jgi:hypothetical protein
LSSTPTAQPGRSTRSTLLPLSTATSEAAAIFDVSPYDR